MDYILLLAAPSLHIPSTFSTSVASALLVGNPAKIQSVWVLDNEKAGRIVIDAILTEVLWREENETLMGFCEVKNDAEGTGFGYSGNVDYMFFWDFNGYHGQCSFNCGSKERMTS
jgi:hypothetical protein